MHLLPTKTIGNYQLSCIPSQLYYIEQYELTLVYYQDTKQCYFFGHDATLQETKTFNIDPVMTMVLYPNSQGKLVVVTSNHIVWLYEPLINYYSTKKTKQDVTTMHVTKKPKLDTNSNQQQLFQTKGEVDWVQHVNDTTFYAFSTASDCIYIYDFDSVHPETIALPQQLGRSLSISKPTCFIYVDFGNDLVTELDPVFADHFGINWQNGVFLGFENGCIFFVPCRDVLNDTAMILQLQFESIAGIHACHLTSTTNVATADYIRAKDTLIVAGSKGTIQIYIKTALEDARQIILFKEFTLPSSVISISFIKGTCSALVFCTNNSLYKVNFTQTITKGPPKKQDVTMDLILLQSPNDIYQLQSVKQHQNILTYQAISKNGNLSSVQVDFDSSPITITRSSDELKKAIENTLTELSQMETNQNILDAYHEQINQQLMLMNKTLYTLQNSNLKKKKNHGSCEDFDLDIQPLVRSAPFTGHQQLFLRVQIRTKLLLNWTSWQLNIDICHQPTLMEESNAQSSGTSEYSLGKSFYIPLDTMENEEDNVGGIIQIWERDIELDARHCILPLNVNTSLTMNMGSLEKLDEDENVPFLEYLPSSSNATNSGITFHVSFTTLDHLHFATPLSSFRLKKLKQSSIKDVTKYMQSKLKESRSGNLYVLNDKIPLDTIYLEHSTVQLRFVTPENNDDLYRSILMTLLSEGKSREDICRIIDNAESAYFTLATHPTYPVAITLSKVPGPIKEDLYVIIQIQCINPLVLVQIEASLLSRLQPYILEEKDDELQKQHTTSSYQIQQQLDDKLASLQTLYRKQYQTGSQTRLMEELQATLDISRQLQNDTWLPIHNFSI